MQIGKDLIPCMFVEVKDINKDVVTLYAKNDKPVYLIPGKEYVEVFCTETGMLYAWPTGNVQRIQYKIVEE